MSRLSMWAVPGLQWSKKGTVLSWLQAFKAKATDKLMELKLRPKFVLSGFTAYCHLLLVVVHSRRPLKVPTPTATAEKHQ